MKYLYYRRYILRIISLIVIGCGFLLLAPLLYDSYQKANAVQAGFDSSTPQQRPVLTGGPALTQGVPARITVPSVGVDLSVIIGSYDRATGSWTLTDTSAQYADQSMPLNNQRGNTLIYAHAVDELFGPLTALKKGDEAFATSVDGDRFRYRYLKREAVAPTHTSVVTEAGSPQLVLQTCSGSFSQNRELYYFKLESIDTKSRR